MINNPINQLLVHAQEYRANGLAQGMTRAVYKTQADIYRDYVNNPKHYPATPFAPTPTGILNSTTGGYSLTFSDGSVYQSAPPIVAAATTFSLRNPVPVATVEEGVVLYVSGRSEFNPTTSEIRLAVRSPSKDRKTAEVDVGGVTMELSRKDITALVSALLEAGSIRRDSE